MLDAATQRSFDERFQAIRSLNQKDLISKTNQTALTIMDTAAGDFFDLQGKTYFIKDINKYEETSDDFSKKKGYFIHELTCLELETGSTVNFEWEHDDELEVAQTLERLSFRNLKDDGGQAIDEDDLDQIADDKDAILFNNEKFWYEDDWAALYLKAGKEDKVYMYEFENESHTKFLTIEEWDSGSGKESYQIYTSQPVNPGNIVIVSQGK